MASNLSTTGKTSWSTVYRSRHRHFQKWKNLNPPSDKGKKEYQMLRKNRVPLLLIIY
ncbi:hypothetical protein AT05_01260 [Schleiferia thermophila str. Yellowstone]|nr:hypothetical protein AT05_01260 [Schleiferia thermophila str. Yellowstone]